MAYIMEIFSFRKPDSVPLLVNPSKTAVKKKKKETPKGAGVV
jgi:hypothetical protein